VRRLALFIVALLGLLALTGAAAAHEVRPAYLQIEQTPAGYDVLWKQPVQGEMAVRLRPHLSNGWLEREPASQLVGPTYLVRSWTVPSHDPAALSGVSLKVEGLERTITNVLVHVELGDGRRQDVALSAEHPQAVLDLAAREGLAAPAYFRLGVVHILTGIDHLAFVLGLMLLIGARWRLFKAITAFTVAHSITLALSALGVVQPPSALIEVLVALSIVFLAAELIRASRGGKSLTLSHPWAIAFLFGLLHGCAFAGALAEVGLPRGAVPLALFLFNLGVEAGQLLFVLAALAIGWLVQRALILVPKLTAAPLAMRVLQQSPAYGIGISAAYWTLERLLVLNS
jgi:hydrogenase/urease accessory protein HupE